MVTAVAIKSAIQSMRFHPFDVIVAPIHHTLNTCLLHTHTHPASELEDRTEDDRSFRKEQRMKRVTQEQQTITRRQEKVWPHGNRESFWLAGDAGTADG